MSDLGNNLTKVYTKDYGLGDDYRLRAVLDSLIYDPKKAAKKNNVSLTSIYKWRKHYGLAALENLMKGERA